MTLQQIHYFVVAARTRSFTRAAEECHVSQPALSYAMKELETELGCALFLRVGRSVRLTEQGERCLEKAMAAERAVEELALAAAKGEPPREITLGYTVLGHLNAYRAFQAERVANGFFREHRLVTVYDEITEIKRRLEQGAYDLIILPAANCRALPPCERVRITPDRLNLIVGRDNALFERQTVRVEELARQRFIFAPNNDDLNRAYTRLCERHGFTPQVVGVGKKMGDIVGEVLQKNAVAFCSATFHYLQSDEIRLLEVEGNPAPFHLELVMLRSNTHAAARALFRQLQRKRPVHA